jgi:drug/metabolite transporter (DMT)-like permease
LPWLSLRGHGFRLSTGGWANIVLAGGLGVFAFNALFFWGLRLAPSIDGSLIVPVLSPVLTTAASMLFLGDHAAPARLAGLAVGVAGAVVFLLGVGDPAGGTRFAGDLIFVAGAAVWSGYTLLGRRILTGIEPVKAIALATTAGALMLAVLAAPALPDVAWGRLPTSFWFNTAYLAIGPTAIAYAGFYRGIRAVGPVNTSIMMLLVPFFGTAGGLLFLHESLTLVQAMGALLMLGGAVLALTDWRVAHRFATSRLGAGVRDRRGAGHVGIPDGSALPNGPALSTPAVRVDHPDQRAGRRSGDHRHEDQDGEPEWTDELILKADRRDDDLGHPPAVQQRTQPQ